MDELLVLRSAYTFPPLSRLEKHKKFGGLMWLQHPWLSEDPPGLNTRSRLQVWDSLVQVAEQAAGAVVELTWELSQLT